MRISGDVAEDIVKEQGTKSKGQDFFVSGPSPPQGMALPFFFASLDVMCKSYTSCF